MNMNPLSALACTCLLASTAFADLRQGTSWLQGPLSPGFAIAYIDLDDESSTVSVTIDYQGLSSPLLQGRLVAQDGKLLITLEPQRAASGVAFGTAKLAPEAFTQVLLSQTRVLLDTTLQPLGEVDGPVSVNLLGYCFPITPAQVSASHASLAHGTGFAMETPAGDAAFSGQLHNLQSTVTSIEIMRSAWHGQVGKLMGTVTEIGQPNPTLVTYSLSLPALSAEEHRDLHDGMCYVIVRTALFPDGEMRGQIRDQAIGDRYCTGRPNSVSFLGASTTLTGSPLAALNDLRLQGSNLPPNKLVLPLVGFGTNHAFAPGGMGLLCVGGAGVGRLNSYAATASSSGTFDAALDLSAFSIGGTVQSAQPGMRLNLQLWYRDPQGPTASNFSSAVSVVFH